MIRRTLVTPLDVVEWDQSPGEGHAEAAIDLMADASACIDELSEALRPTEALQVQLIPSARRLLGIIYDPADPPWQGTPAMSEDFYP